jgi:hypothetical protein
MAAAIDAGNCRPPAARIVTASTCRKSAARPCDRRRSRLLPSRSRPRASPSTARRLCSGVTACHGLKSYAAGTPRTPRPSMPSISSSMTARIPQECAGALFAQYRGWYPIQRTHRRGRPYHIRARLPAWRRGHRVEEVDGTYRSRPCPVWIKVRNRAGIAAQRERSEIWNR